MWCQLNLYYNEIKFLDKVEIMTKPRFTIQSINCYPGTLKTIYFPLPSLYDLTAVNMPVHVICGKKQGPTIWVTAAIHGDEINGIEIVRRLLKKPGLRKMAGNLIVIPIVNVYGFLYQKRHLMDRRDLNRSFPGSLEGSIASRLANLIVSEICPLATHVIDLHSGSNHRFNLPQIRTNLDIQENEALALAFNSPVILHSAYRDGSLREYVNEKGIPFLLYEAGEALRFDELSIRTGLNGILSVMASLDMISAGRYRVKQFSPVVSRHSSWIRAPQSGILRALKKAGQKIIKGQTIAIICNPANQQEYKLQSPISGIIIGDNKLPLIHEGEALFHVASFDSLSSIEEQLDSIQDIYDLTDDDAIF